MSREEEQYKWRKYKSKRDEDKKDYKDKGKKFCYISKEETKDGSGDHDDEVVYVAMKNHSNEDEENALVSYVNKSNIDRWIIDIGCLHHIIRDKVSSLTLIIMMEIV